MASIDHPTNVGPIIKGWKSTVSKLLRSFFFRMDLQCNISPPFQILQEIWKGAREGVALEKK